MESIPILERLRRLGVESGIFSGFTNKRAVYMAADPCVDELERFDRARKRLVPDESYPR